MPNAPLEGNRPFQISNRRYPRDDWRTKILSMALIVVIGFVSLVAIRYGPPTADASSSDTTAPYIVENGVKMVDSWNMLDGAWQAWWLRPPGDDTYGAGDLFVVSVEFNEPVSIDSDTTFYFASGYFNTKKELVYVAQDGNTAFFGTTVGGFWYDLDGIYIGNGDWTLGHNDADAITSVATGANADTSHPELGTLPDHKVNGEYWRPRIEQIELVRPACGDTYRRGETITIKVKFDRNVRVYGTPQAAITIKQTKGKWSRRASYADGSGTDTINLEYLVSETDMDPRGIRIDQNAMLIQREVGRVPLNRANIVRQRSGLYAELRVNGIDRRLTNSVDGSRRLSLYCPTPVPEALAQVLWQWNGEQETSTQYSVKFTVHQDPGVGDLFENTVFSAGSLMINNHRFLIGINNAASDPRESAAPTKGAFCATWDPVARSTAHAIGPEGWKIQPSNVAGDPTATVIPYEWGTGTYTMTVVRAQSGSTFDIYKCYIKSEGDDTDGNGIQIGSFGYSGTSSDAGVTINPNSPQTSSSIAQTGEGSMRPIDIPVMKVEVNRPKFEGMRRPRYGLVLYSPVHGIAANARVTFISSAQTITLLAGGETSRPAGDGTPIRFTFNARRK